MNNKTLVLSLILFTSVTGCSDDSKPESNVTAQQNIVSRADALSIATDMVTIEQKDGYRWSAVEKYDIKDVINIRDKVVAYEIAVSDANNQPLGYVHVPVVKTEGIGITTFNYEGYAHSHTIEKLYNEIWKKQLEQNGITVTEKKLVGGTSGFLAVAIKTQQPVNNIGNIIDRAVRMGEYYVIPFHVVKDLAYVIGFTQQPIKSSCPSSGSGCA